MARCEIETNLKKLEFKRLLDSIEGQVSPEDMLLLMGKFGLIKAKKHDDQWLYQEVSFELPENNLMPIIIHLLPRSIEEIIYEQLLKDLENHIIGPTAATTTGVWEWRK